MNEDPLYGVHGSYESFQEALHSHDPRVCPECIEHAQRELAKAPHDRQIKAPRRNRAR